MNGKMFDESLEPRRRTKTTGKDKPLPKRRARWKRVKESFHMMIGRGRSE